MTELPNSNKLPIEHLAACFNRVTNSYKFYWFLAILEHIKENQTSIIPLDTLLANMVAQVWYPTNAFRLSFGKQDRLSQIALKLKTKNGLTLTAKKKEVVAAALETMSGKSKLGDELKSLGRFVPQRFVRPFFAAELKGIKDAKVDKLIVELAAKSFTDDNNLCLYRFRPPPQESIEIQPDWFVYLQDHLQILTGFSLWHLLNYLQKNNLNVPNVAAKLLEPKQRDLTQAKAFWNIAFTQLSPVHCIYSNQVMLIKPPSLDHFLPWRFVTHDLLWNIVPTPQPINSAKHDNLPNIKLYFNNFAQLQYNAVQTVATQGKPGLLEDYILLFKAASIAEIQALTFESFRQTLHDTIMPQIQIAKNMGFQADWSY